MKARLVLFLIFLTTAGMASTLYYVLKHSSVFQSQAARQMLTLWVANVPESVGPFQIQAESILVSFPKLESDWSLRLEGEKLILRPKKVGYSAAPGSKAALSEEGKAEAWKLAQGELRSQISEVLKLQKNPDQVLIQSP